MKRINKNLEDLVDVIDSCHIEDIVNIAYYTDGEAVIEGDNVFRSEQDGKIVVKIDASLLAQLADGQLFCKIFYSHNDSDFADGSYNEIVDEGLPIWLVSE